MIVKLHPNRKGQLGHFLCWLNKGFFSGGKDFEQFVRQVDKALDHRHIIWSEEKQKYIINEEYF